MADGAYVEFDKLQARALKELDLTESERFAFCVYSDKSKVRECIVERSFVQMFVLE